MVLTEPEAELPAFFTLFWCEKKEVTQQKP
jgi:hypothetical protein